MCSNVFVGGFQEPIKDLFKLKHGLTQIGVAKDNVTAHLWLQKAAMTRCF